MQIIVSKTYNTWVNCFQLVCGVSAVKSAASLMRVTAFFFFFLLASFKILYHLILTVLIIRVL